MRDHWTLSDFAEIWLFGVPRTCRMGNRLVPYEFSTFAKSVPPYCSRSRTLVFESCFRSKIFTAPSYLVCTERQTFSKRIFLLAIFLCPLKYAKTLHTYSASSRIIRTHIDSLKSVLQLMGKVFKFFLIAILSFWDPLQTKQKMGKRCWWFAFYCLSTVDGF